MVNATMNQISGAAVSDQEALRLAKQLPDLKQNPAAFKAVWDNIMQDRYNTYRSKVEDYSGSGMGGLDPHIKNISKYEGWAADRGWRPTSALQTAPASNAPVSAPMPSAPAPTQATFSPDVMQYAKTHGITPDQANKIKMQRMGGR
jgi:hypothetical protein